MSRVTWVRKLLAEIAVALLMRRSDIFWTFTYSAWNTTFKLLFIGSQAYIVYLMLTDYKPTHDPGTDTFQVQYLLGGSAVLAVLFPYEYTTVEVPCSAPEARIRLMCWQ
jgi:ER lumen protein retaining receptor